MTRFNQDLIQQLITGTSLIFIFISIKASPLGSVIDGNWLWFLIGSIIIFIFAPAIARKTTEVI